MGQLSQATLMMLSPLLKHGIECKGECVDDVCLWSDEKESPRDSVGGSTDELELEVISDTVEALWSGTAGIGRNSVIGTLCFAFPCPRVSSSIGLSLTPNWYAGIIGNPLIFLVSGAAWHTGGDWDTLSWFLTSSSSIGIAGTWHTKFDQIMEISFLQSKLKKMFLTLGKSTLSVAGNKKP